MKNSSRFYRLEFKPYRSRPKQKRAGGFLSGVIGGSVFPDPLKNMLRLGDFVKDIKYHLYSPEETVERAKSKLGERDYGLFKNNCEHFAIWCKTGISESYQVRDCFDMVAGSIVY